MDDGVEYHCGGGWVGRWWTLVVDTGCGRGGSSSRYVGVCVPTGNDSSSGPVPWTLPDGGAKSPMNGYRARYSVLSGGATGLARGLGRVDIIWRGSISIES